MNKEIEITPKDIAKALNDLLEEKEQLKEKIKKAIEIIKLCNTPCAKELLEILGDKE